MNVFSVPEILETSFRLKLLIKVGLKLASDFGGLVITRNREYERKGFVTGGILL